MLRPPGAGVDARHQRRCGDDAEVAVHQLGHLGEDLQVGARAGARDEGLGALADVRREGSQHLVDAEVRVPQLEVAHRRVLGHLEAIGTQRAPDRVHADRVAATEVPRRDHRAGSHALDVPLPGPRVRLVEVVHAEDEVALLRPEQTEVHDVAIAAGLDGDAGHRRRGQVVGHHGGRAAQEREGRGRHAAHADGHQLGHPRVRSGARGARWDRGGRRRAPSRRARRAARACGWSAPPRSALPA